MSYRCLMIVNPARKDGSAVQIFPSHPLQK